MESDRNPKDAAIEEEMIPNAQPAGRHAVVAHRRFVITYPSRRITL
jgi:hypothetical protein